MMANNETRWLIAMIVVAFALALGIFFVDAFAYTTTRHWKLLFPLIAANVFLLALAIARKRQTVASPTHSTPASNRRVRVTGPVK